MAGIRIDLDRVKAVLKDATKDASVLSQRGLSKKAHESRDCVGDIINGRNKNPTLKVLSNLAHAMDSDLTLFGIKSDARMDVPTDTELETALLEVMPDMPRGSLDKRARYLAESVAQILRLPRSHQATGAGLSDRPPGDNGGDAPLPGATN